MWTAIRAVLDLAALGAGIVGIGYVTYKVVVAVLSAIWKW